MQDRPLTGLDRNGLFDERQHLPSGFFSNFNEGRGLVKVKGVAGGHVMLNKNINQGKLLLDHFRLHGAEHIGDNLHNVRHFCAVVLVGLPHWLNHA